MNTESSRTECLLCARGDRWEKFPRWSERSEAPESPTVWAKRVLGSQRSKFEIILKRIRDW